MARNKAALLKPGKTVEHETPQGFFDKLNEEFRFTVDMAATKENAKCKKFYTKENSGLVPDLEGERAWCNPPYGREIGNWVHKAWFLTQLRLGPEVVVMLLPARTDTKWFHDYILPFRKCELRFIRGRLKFGGAKNSAPFPSMLVVFRKDTHI